MSKSNITFSVDRKSAKEGETITVTWDCGMPDSVSLRVDNGYRTMVLQLPDNGSRAILVEKAKRGKLVLRLNSACGIHKEQREISVKVKNIKPIRAQEVHSRRSSKGHKGWSVGSPKELWQRIKNSLRSFVQKLEYGWRVMPPRTKRIYKFLLILLAAMWVSSIGQSRGYKAGYQQAIEDSRAAEQRYYND